MNIFRTTFASISNYQKFAAVALGSVDNRVYVFIMHLFSLDKNDQALQSILSSSQELLVLLFGYSDVWTKFNVCRISTNVVFVVDLLKKSMGDCV